MKKLLVLISLILCVSMLFAACAAKDDVENSQPDEQNVEANINKVVTELNKAESLDDIFNTVKTTVDYEQLVAELKKVSAKGSIDLTATTDGEDVGTVTGSFAIKDNVLHAEANNGEETVGIDASISDAYKLVFATWIDEEVELDIGEVMAFDIAAIYEELMAQVNEGLEEQMPIDLKEIKLPEFTEANLKYEDGKYILDKQFLYDSIVATAESFIDAAKEEGLITDEDIDEQFTEIKETAKKVVDAVEFEIYFVVNHEVIEGMGVSVNVKSADLAAAIDEDAEDMAFDYFKASVEVTLNGSKASIEYKELENSYINKMNYDVKFLFDDGVVCGVDAKYDMDFHSESKSESRPEANDEYGYWSNSESESIQKQSISVKFDLSNFDKANATVLDLKANVYDEYDYSNEWGSNYDETQKNETHRLSETEFAMTVKTTEANKADVSMSGKIHNVRDYSDEHNEDYEEEHSIGIYGTVEFTTKDVTVPAPDADVKDAMDNAEIITSIEEMGGSAENYPMEETTKTPEYGYEEDIYYPMPEETMNEEW